MKIKRIILFFLLVNLCFLFSSCNFSFSNNYEAGYEAGYNAGYEVGREEEKYEYEFESDGTVKIIQRENYHKEDTVITVPETIQGAPVSVLGKDAFYKYGDAISIILPDSLTTIEGNSFFRCESLKEINIPKNVSAILDNPFWRCDSLENITVDSGNEYFCDVDGVLFNKDKTVLITYPEGRTDESYTVPETVVSLTTDPFGFRTKLKYVTILSNVTEFPENIMFDFVEEEITLFVEAGSAAEQYAIEYGINYEIIERE